MKQCPLNIQIPESLLSELDGLVPAAQAHERFRAMGRVTRSLVAREAIYRGIDQLKADLAPSEVPAKK